jgi:hypothetical protein
LTSLRGVLNDYVKYNFPLERITEKYKEWVSEDTYMVLSKWNREKSKNDVYAVKCSKRGNDVYRSRVESRFRGLVSKSKDLVFFNTKDKGKKKTPALWISLTYDSKLTTYKEAWEQIGSQFNRFMAYVRREYGKVSCCRVFESFEKGYPHIHAILLFNKTSFSVFESWEINKKTGQRQLVYRITEKESFEGYWHSFIDIQGMSSLSWGFNYLKKYLLKAIDFENSDSKGLKTLALCWLFRKRAFAVSGSFRKALSDLITRLHNSNKPLVQITLLGEIIPEEKFFLLGFVAGKDIKIENKVWFTILNSEQVGLLNSCLKEKTFF